MQPPPPFTTAVPPPPLPARLRVQRPRSLQLALFFAALVWYFCARALAASSAAGLTGRFDLSDFEPLLESIFLLFLIVIGFALLRAIERRRAPLRLTLGLPRRATAPAEWLGGAAIGWGIAVTFALVLAVLRTLNLRLWTAPRAFELLALSVATLAVSTLAHAMAIYGYGFQRLIEAIGPTRATVLLAMLSGLYIAVNPDAFGAPIATRIVVEVLASVLLAVCWLRTHGLWLLWGLHFAWAAATAILFGLPMAASSTFSSVIETRTIGPVWLTGGSYGPGASLLSVLLILAAVPILVGLTSDYAYAYTHPPLIPAGYDVTIAPPAAHLAMEEAARPVSAASLVQILPAASPPDRQIL